MLLLDVVRGGPSSTTPGLVDLINATRDRGDTQGLGPEKQRILHAEFGEKHVEALANERIECLEDSGMRSLAATDSVSRNSATGLAACRAQDLMLTACGYRIECFGRSFEAPDVLVQTQVVIAQETDTAVLQAT